MKIIDKVYGEEEIWEGVLIDLINSKSVQRLKYVSQFGLPQIYYHLPVYSRYEHSIGVLILLRKLNANLKEQIAGLLHDISHTSFSHIIDWVIGNPAKEDYQDSIYEEVLENSEIPKILKKHNLDHNEIKDLKKFSLLEKEAPSLCADRIDYSLREFIQKDKKNVHFLIENLINYNGQIVFNSDKAAKIFAEGYLELQKNHWAGE